MSDIKVGDFLFGYPIVRVNDEKGEAEIRLPQNITVFIGAKQTFSNVAAFLRQWGLWVPQTPLEA